MKIYEGEIEITSAQGFYPGHKKIRFHDQSGNKVWIPNETIIRAYEVLKHDCKSLGIDFDEFCKSMLHDNENFIRG